MIAELRLPNLDLPGVSVRTCSWHVGLHQRVSAGERLLEILAGDVVVDLPAPATGTLVERCVRTEDALEVGQLLARIETET